MADIKDAIRAAIKELMLPEIEAIRKDNQEIKARLELTNKRIDDINIHLADQSRRIDETNNKIDAVRDELLQKIDETNNKIDAVRDELLQKIDETNRRIDQVIFQTTRIAQEMERIKREEKVTADILDRLRALEKKVYATA